MSYVYVLSALEDRVITSMPRGVLMKYQLSSSVVVTEP